MINHHKKIVISPLGLWKAQHVVHRYGFLRPFRIRKRGVHALFLNFQFGNGKGITGPGILVDIMSKFQPIEMLLHHCHYSGIPKLASLSCLMECRYGPDGAAGRLEDGNW
jgi:hypothetical protein